MIIVEKKGNRYMLKTIAASTGILIALLSAPVIADGKAVYEKACKLCHMAGIAGAPKLGDKAAWAERIKQDIATLENRAIKGYKGKKGVMPPQKGGIHKLSDADVKAGVAYMVNTVK